MAADRPRVTLVPGEGVGPQVTAAARRVLDATGVAIDWHVREATDLDAVLASIRESGVALKGPTATAVAGARSFNLALRRELDLFAGVRPSRALRGMPTRFPEADLVVVRMNHEDLYAGLEYPRDDPGAERLRGVVRETLGAEIAEDAGVSLKPLSASGARRVARAAFAYARAHGRARVTAVHKATVMRATDGLFLEVAREVAAEHPDVAFDDRLVDTVCHQLVTRPAECDVLLCPTLYGDLLSDLGAGLAGGLGMAPGANLGDGCAVFEAVHGTAAHRVGAANPMAAILSGAMLLDHVGASDAATAVRAAVARVVAGGERVTYDLRDDRDPARAASTDEAADAVIAALG